MPSPFPGMDPDIEQRTIWQDFHSNLASEIQGRLNPLLRPRYYAAFTPYMTYEEVEIAIPRAGRPNVGVLHSDEGPGVAAAKVAIHPAPAETGNAP